MTGEPSAGHTAFVGYDFDMDAERLCTRLLAEEGVLVSPGDYFGTPRHLRIRHSGPKEELPRALARFSSFLRRLRD